MTDKENLYASEAIDNTELKQLKTSNELKLSEKGSCIKKTFRNR